ncbi:hypothetical protein AOLI_G00014770 [Acnodon oligacanthus]
MEGQSGQRREGEDLSGRDGLFLERLCSSGQCADIIMDSRRTMNVNSVQFEASARNEPKFALVGEELTEKRASDFLLLQLEARRR